METAGKGHNKRKSNTEDAWEGPYDISEKKDIFSEREHPHVKKQVEPGKGDCDGAGLPLETCANISLKEVDLISGHNRKVVDGDVEGEDEDKIIKEENKRKWFEGRAEVVSLLALCCQI